MTLLEYLGVGFLIYPVALVLLHYWRKKSKYLYEVQVVLEATKGASLVSTEQMRIAIPFLLEALEEEGDKVLGSCDKVLVRLSMEKK